MFIAKKTFTSKHNHEYTEGQEINLITYELLSHDDKENFEKKHHVDEGHEEHKDEEGATSSEALASIALTSGL